MIVAISFPTTTSNYIQKGHRCSSHMCCFQTPCLQVKEMATHCPMMHHVSTWTISLLQATPSTPTLREAVQSTYIEQINRHLSIDERVSA
jgi:hypothetical protein